MSVKMLYLHWVEGTPQLCPFPSVRETLWWSHFRLEVLLRTPSKVQCPDARWPMAHPDGTVSGVLVKLDRGQKGRLEKSRVDMCWGASGFWQWNSDISRLEPLMSLTGLHSSSSTLYPFQCTRYSSLPLNSRLSKIHSTSYLSRTGFLIRLKSNKVEIGQERTLLIDVKQKLSERAVVKERRLGRVFPQERRWTPIWT